LGVGTSSAAALNVQSVFDFNPALPAQFRVAGSAKWVASGGVTNGGYASLTDAATYQRGALLMADIFQGVSVAGFSLDLQARIGGGTANPGDGLSINFARAGDPVLADPLNGWRRRRVEEQICQRRAALRAWALALMRGPTAVRT